jgi:hypothetical protein
VFDRYLDLVQKYLKPEVVCLYVYDYQCGTKGHVSVLDPGNGQVSVLDTPVYGPTPEATAFWKPVMTEVNARLEKRGLGGNVPLGMVVEGGHGAREWGGKGMQPVVELFKGIWPEGKWTQVAHQGGGGGAKIHGVPLGYVMSVDGNFSPYRSKLGFGNADLPLILIQHFREGSRYEGYFAYPNSPRGNLMRLAEVSMGGNRGLGPLGVDFWNLTAEERGDPPEKGAHTLESGDGHFWMCQHSTGAFLAPGPEGPISTARFDIFREGIQACEAHVVVHKALGDEATRQRLGAPLVKRCQEALKERGPALDYHFLSYAFDWDSLNGKLFSCAGEVTRALAGK